MKHIIRTAALSAIIGITISLPAKAQVAVEDAWVRATVTQQKTTGAFMRITSARNARLVEATSPIAGVIEIHEMSMDKDIMRMRAIKALDLPAGKTVELKSGGYHLMLMGLKQQMKDGDSVPIALVVESKDGKRKHINVSATVKPLFAPAGAESPHKH